VADSYAGPYATDVKKEGWRLIGMLGHQLNFRLIPPSNWRQAARDTCHGEHHDEGWPSKEQHNRRL
jgi:hypothetical protein